MITGKNTCNTDRERIETETINLLTLCQLINPVVQFKSKLHKTLYAN